MERQAVLGCLGSWSLLTSMIFFAGREDWGEGVRDVGSWVFPKGLQVCGHLGQLSQTRSNHIRFKSVMENQSRFLETPTH